MPQSVHPGDSGLRRQLKLAALAAAALAGLAGVAFLGALWMGERKLGRTVAVRVVPVPYAKDAAAARLGRDIYVSSGCGACHGEDGAGGIALDAPDGFFVRAPNITRGPGGVVADYDEADWVRAIRHGVSPAGRALLAMPSEAFNRLDDGEFAALVAYVRSLPAVAGAPAEKRMPALVKARYGVGLLRDAAERIDHRRPPLPAPARSALP